MKNQIIFIHGWEAFDNSQEYHDFLREKSYDPYKLKVERWKQKIHDEVWDNFEVFSPNMPAKNNSDYIAWKIWFEKLFEYLNDSEPIIIWTSLGWIFLTKYLSENDFPKNISQLHLVASVFDESWLEWEWVGNFKLEDFEGLRNIQNKAEKIFLYHSRDDFVVPYEHAEKYLEYLPDAEFMSFEDRGHFLQAEFPELIENIKKNI